MGVCISRDRDGGWAVVRSQYRTVNDHLKHSGLWSKEPCFFKRTKEPKRIPSPPGQTLEFANRQLQADSSLQLYFVWL